MSLRQGLHRCHRLCENGSRQHHQLWHESNVTSAESASCQRMFQKHCSIWACVAHPSLFQRRVKETCSTHSHNTPGYRWYFGRHHNWAVPLPVGLTALCSYPKSTIISRAWLIGTRHLHCKKGRNPLLVALLPHQPSRCSRSMHAIGPAKSQHTPPKPFWSFVRPFCMTHNSHHQIACSEQQSPNDLSTEISTLSLAHKTCTTTMPMPIPIKSTARSILFDSVHLLSFPRTMFMFCQWSINNRPSSISHSLTLSLSLLSKLNSKPARQTAALYKPK